jgi:hypothetical protein
MGINITSVLGPADLCTCGYQSFWLISKTRKGSVVSCQRCFQYHFIPGSWRKFSWPETWARLLRALQARATG